MVGMSVVFDGTADNDDGDHELEGDHEVGLKSDRP
jgi:hypothetical protein